MSSRSVIVKQCEGRLGNPYRLKKKEVVGGVAVTNVGVEVLRLSTELAQI